MNQVSNLLKNASDDISYYARYHRWWGGAVQVGPEQDGNWTWIESGAPVQNWAWGRLYPGSRNDTNNFVFQFFTAEDKYYGVDKSSDYFALPVCQKAPSGETTTLITDTTNGEDFGKPDTVPLIAGIFAGVVIIVIVVTVIVYSAYRQYQDKKAWAMVGGTRPPKFGPSTDYCEGYYGDDRPRRRGLNDVEL